MESPDMTVMHALINQFIYNIISYVYYSSFFRLSFSFEHLEIYWKFYKASNNDRLIKTLFKARKVAGSATYKRSKTE